MYLQVLDQNIVSIRELNICLPSSLNGPEGSVAAKTVDSLKLLKWGLERLKQNPDLDLKTLTSLAVRHWISKTYIQSFITTAKLPQHFSMNVTLKAQHWISKTYIQSFITRAKLPQHFSMNVTLKAQQKRVSSVQHHGWPIISQAVNPSPQFWRSPLVSLKFHQFNYLQQSKHPKKKIQ